MRIKYKQLLGKVGLALSDVVDNANVALWNIWMRFAITYEAGYSAGRRPRCPITVG